MLFLAGAGYEDYEKVKLACGILLMPPCVFTKYRVVVEFCKKKRRL